MDKKISQLTAAATPLAGTETLPIVQGGSTVKTTVQDVLGYLVNDSTNSILKTVYSSNNIGMLLDFTGSYKFGDFDLLNSGTYIDINDGFSVISLQAGTNNNGGTQLALNDTFSLIATSYQNNNIGLKLDFANDSYVLGDWNDVALGTRVELGDKWINILSQKSGLSSATAIYVDGQNEFISSQYNGNNIGLKLDFANNTFILGNPNVLAGLAGGIKVDTNNNATTIGDFNLSNNATTFFIDDNNAIIKSTYFYSDTGLKLDFANGIYWLGTDPATTGKTGFWFDVNNCDSLIGDGANVNNGVNLSVYNSTQTIKTQNGGNDIGLKLDFANGYFSFGTPVQNGNYLFINESLNTLDLFVGLTGGNSTNLQLNDNNSLIKTTYQGNDIGLNLHFGNGEYQINGGTGAQIVAINGGVGSGTVQIGDYTATGNLTLLVIDDQNQRWEMSNNLTEATAGGSASKFLKVYINGVTYKIALLNN